MLKERQKNILDVAIRDYIQTARPVASRDLVRKFRLGVSPATARNEMLELDELGYLEQPHTSAGRVPTDKGYRFFVDNLLDDFPLGEKDRALIAELFRVSDGEEFARDAARGIARAAKAFTAFSILEDNIFYDAGFSEVLGEPEFTESENVKMFSRLVDRWEDEAQNFFENLNDEEDERIFIGEENALAEGRGCAVFISRFCHPRGFEGFITLVSPKRTNYPRHKALLKNIQGYERQRR